MMPSRARTMSRLIRFLGAITLLTVTGGVAGADDRACTLAESGYGYIKVVERGEEWTYGLKASGPKWKTAPNGYHSAGGLFCDDCMSGGDFHLFVQSGAGSNPTLRPPTTAAERAERREEFFVIVLGPDRLEHLGSREMVRLGPLSGYAVLYRFTLPGGNASDRNERAAIALKDGRVEFEASISGRLSTGGRDWASLDSLLSEVWSGQVRARTLKFLTGVGAPYDHGERARNQPIFTNQIPSNSHRCCYSLAL